MKENFAYVLEFMFTFDKMQTTSPLMCTKFEILGQSILKVIQVFHTVRIVLYIGCSGQVIEWLNKSICCSQGPDHRARTPDKLNYAYIMKTLNNIKNTPASVFELFSH